MNKKIKNLPYSLFLAEERFQLYIEALYRGDKEEVNHLVQTAPYGAHGLKQIYFLIYRMISEEMVNSLRLALEQRLAKLRTIEAFQEVLRPLSKESIRAVKCAYAVGSAVGSRRAWHAAGNTGEPPWCKEGEESDEDPLEEWGSRLLLMIINSLEEETEELVGSLEEMKRLLIQDSLTIWEAFSACCKEKCDLEPEKLVKAYFEPLLADIEWLKSLPDPPELDPEELKEYEELFERGWNEC